MADDDFDDLLRQVEASLSPGAPAPSTRPVEQVEAAPEQQATRGASTVSRLPGALVAGLVAGGGVWLAITLLSGLRWLAVILAFALAMIAWLLRP